MFTFHELLNIFLENKVEIKHLGTLSKSPDIIKELIPNIGFRLSFMQKLEEYVMICNADLIINEDTSANKVNINFYFFLLLLIYLLV